MNTTSYETAFAGLNNDAIIRERAWELAKKPLMVVSVSGVKRGFAQQTAPDGTPWTPLKFARPSGGQKILRDKGLLMASISASVTEKTITLSANSPGARLHQFGGVIRPKRAKVLTIPVSKEAARIGSPRKFPRPLFSARGGLCEHKGEELVMHYRFASSVTVPARPFLGWSQETLESVENIIADAYAKAIALSLRGH